MPSSVILPSRVHHLILFTISSTAVVSVVEFFIFILPSLIIAVVVIPTVAAIPSWREAFLDFFSIHRIMIIPAGSGFLAELRSRSLDFGVHSVHLPVDIDQVEVDVSERIQ